MKSITDRAFVLLICCLFAFPTRAQNNIEHEKVPQSQLQAFSSVDGILETLYSVISGEKGQTRNWELFRSLFHPEAKLIPTRTSQEGLNQALYWSVEDYIHNAGDYLVQNGFFEKEIHRVSETFGGMVHIFSTYESYRSTEDTEPFARGINSIQLMHDGQRWWILNIYWQSESAENPIPDKYLPQ